MIQSVKNICVSINVICKNERNESIFYSSSIKLTALYMKKVQRNKTKKKKILRLYKKNCKVMSIKHVKILTSIVGLVALGGDSGDCAAKLDTSEVVRWFANEASEPSPKFVGRSLAPPTAPPP